VQAGAQHRTEGSAAELAARYSNKGWRAKNM
jgi:hypothetical protein